MGVLRLNGKEYGGGSGGSGSEDVELTIAEYIALPDTKLSDDKNYFITDINNDNVLGYPPLIYSGEEREIGVWRDGKPLYEKCFTYSSASFSNQQMTLTNDLSNVDYVVNYGGCAKEPRDNRNVPLPYLRKAWNECLLLQIMQLPGGTVSTAICTNDSWYTSLENIKIWVQYTKTTDTPGAGIWNGQGCYAHHYSTNETVIGTWYNGKPIYEKTYELSSALLVEYTSWTNTTIDSSNIQTVIDAKGYNADGTFYGTVMADPTGSSHTLLGLQTTRNNSQVNVKVLTIQYTKITD